MAYVAEREIANIPGGCQDQFVCNVGGLRRYEFGPDLEVSHYPIMLSFEILEQLQRNIYLIETGISRDGLKVLEDQIQKNISSDNDSLLKQQKILLNEFEKSIVQGNLTQMGMILNESWDLKKKFGKYVSNNRVDKVYRELQLNGSLGGKLLGAGGGGTLLVVTNEENSKRLESKIARMSLNYTRLQFFSEGAKLVES
jgi:D-glycero-alpha-D-manno-heptose-7-phosphate kinase